MPGSTPQALGASADPAGALAGIRGAVTTSPRLVAGRYELVSAIGGGGMGSVYRAEDRLLGRTVAVKVLPAGGAGDRSLVARFRREASAAAGLCHPNVVSVFDAGSDDTTCFIVMEYVRGISLAELLSRRGRLQATQAIDLAVQIAGGLTAAHRAGIVHRDVKPANVMVDESGTVKLLDFGIAHTRASTTLTQAGSVMGSAHYIAPELVQGRAAEERSDVYSLGCVLYEMVTGRPPFCGELDAAVLHQHVSVRPRPPRTLVTAIPRALDHLIMQMLAKRVAERPPAAELVTALARSLMATRIRTARPADRRAGELATGPLPRLERARPRHRGRLRVAAVIVAVIAGIGLAIAAHASHNGRGAGQNAASAASLHEAVTASRGERHSWHLVPASASAFRDVAAFAASAAAQLEAARAPAPPVVPPRKPPAKRKAHTPQAHGKRDHGPRQTEWPRREVGEAPPTAGAEPDTPVSVGEAEAPPTETSPTETPPTETPPPESPAP